MSLVRFTVPIACMVGLVLTGCAGGPPKPVTIVGEIRAAEALNPDPGGRASPVVLRIYQLKTDGAFKTTDFFALYGDADAVLSGDLLSTEELVLRPGETRIYEGKFDPQAGFVGAMAAFRDIENATWRGTVALPQGKAIPFVGKRKLLIELEPLAISVSFIKR